MATRKLTGRRTPASRRRASRANGAVASGVAALAAATVAGCGQIGQMYYGITESPMSCAEARDYSDAGTASWYGRAHHGRRTASGEAFDMNGMTAAHRTLPFGSRIRVTNSGNGRSVVLTVNDRGPFIVGRVVDVSWRAARELNFVGAGLAPVHIETVAAC